MTQHNLLTTFQYQEQLARSSNWARFFHAPLKYASAQFFLRMIYPLTKKGRPQSVKTFFGDDIQVVLPAAMDLHLLGIKTHDSELRLTRFLMNSLQPGDVFIDLGAHYGYFSLLAAHLVGEEGKVCAFDASASTFQLLAQNLAGHKNVEAFHKAVSDVTGKKLSFYEFPTLYSEFNSRFAQQYEGERWFGKIKPKKIEVDAITLDHFLAALKRSPSLIKIDVEGGEWDVLKGMSKTLSVVKPPIIMEFSSKNAKNGPHWKAYEFLTQSGYRTYLIDHQGQVAQCGDLAAYLSALPEESDNIVFQPE